MKLPPVNGRLAGFPRKPPPILYVSSLACIAADQFCLLCLLLLCLAASLQGCRQTPLRQNRSGAQLVDIAARAGVTHAYTTHAKPNTPLNILETIGHGCAFLDFDNDGNLDILLVDTDLFLYRGDGHGHFSDVSREAGLDKMQGHFLGCAVGDYDNDGYADLYISGYDTGRLLHNEVRIDRTARAERSPHRHSSPAKHIFRDVTLSAGLKPQPWGTSCGFVDMDGDGRLDLVIANYVEFGPDPRKYMQLCEPLACPPQDYNAEKPVYYHNLGGGRFADETQSSGLIKAAGKGLGVAFADYDGDGRQDILFANDEVEGDLFHNNGHGLLSNVGVAAGVAYGPEGRVHGGMGADWADCDGDGRLDALVTTYADQAKSLYHNDGNGLFTDLSVISGIQASTAQYVAFGVKWLDYDNDGSLDLLIANGNVDNNIAVMMPKQTYRQPTQLLRNRGVGSAGKGAGFDDVSKEAGNALQKPIVGRGLAVGDFDNDGRMDALVIDNEGPVLLLHNEGGRPGNWIGLSLQGANRSNRDAIGARVTIESGGRSQMREVQTAGSYLSASDHRLLFGIGQAVRIDKVTIRWPDGQVQVLGNLAINRYYQIRERPAE